MNTQTNLASFNFIHTCYLFFSVALITVFEDFRDVESCEYLSIMHALWEVSLVRSYPLFEDNLVFD
ncbi:hypothetical protein IC582_014372 [Cucumis melo]